MSRVFKSIRVPSPAVPALCTVALLACSLQPALARAPDTYEGLYKVKSKRFDLAYVATGVDFTAYDAVLLEEPKVAFQRNWQRNYNSSASFDRRIDDEEAAQILEAARDGIAQVFAETFREHGYTLATSPGPKVLTLNTAVIDLQVNAPDTMTAGRSVTFSREAGEAKLVVEVRDSTSGALLGRAIDRRTIGDGPIYRRDMVTNRSDFERAFGHWAKISTEALDDLRAAPVLDAKGEPASPAG